MTNITTQELADALSPYGSVSSVNHSNIKTYIDLLIQWNQKISLTTIVDPTEIARLHFGESIFAAAAIPILGGRLADVGTGAGFPGIPLKMVIPQLDLTLIEPTAKKTAFLSEVIRKLEIDSVHIIRSRMEDLPIESGLYDFITARALGRHIDFLKWSREYLSDSGHVILWLGELDANAVSKQSGWNWRQIMQIPRSDSRCILVGSPQR